MFEIQYKGANSIIISTKNSKLLVDPKLSIVGLKDLQTKDEVELATEERFAIYNPSSKLVIDGPGEYGVGDFDILGVPARRHIDTEDEGLKSTMYRVEVDESRIGIIGNIDDKLSDEQLEKLGVLDILVIPVGGNGYTLDATSAASLVRLIAPKVVIPVHYADNQTKYEVPQGELGLFIAELGAPVETMTKYKSKQANSLQAQLSVVELKRS
jgi:L-ascorbate metabolism protein UlaG (beta-lactamase superfamily)